MPFWDKKHKVEDDPETFEEYQEFRHRDEELERKINENKHVSCHC